MCVSVIQPIAKSWFKWNVYNLDIRSSVLTIMCANWKKYISTRRTREESESRWFVSFFNHKHEVREKIRIAHTAEKNTREETKSVPFSLVYNLRTCVYALCVCHIVYKLWQKRTQSILMYAYTYRTYATLTSACWLLLPGRIFISMASHIHFFYMLKHLRSFLFYFMHSSHTHIDFRLFAYFIIYAVCACVVRLCLLSIRFPSVMCVCIVYSVCVCAEGIFVSTYAWGKKSHVIFIYADGWLLLYYPFITPSSFHFSFDFCSFFSALCVCSFFSLVRNDFR